MSVRVGTIKSQNQLISYPDYTQIVVMTASSPYASLSPYVLRDEDGILIENRWQFSKLYPSVPATTQRYSRWDSRVIWDHPAETHSLDVGDRWRVLETYWKWREKGFRNPFAVRYPVGFHHRSSCVGAIDGGRILNYIEARKEIYLKYYVAAVRKQPQFQELQQRLAAGENLLILEVDGPKQESLGYYMEKYGVPSDWISESSIPINEKNLEILLNDERHPFGHGFCLAGAVLGIY